MANSILTSISSILTPEVIGRLASATGLDRSMAQTAVGAAVPSILSALANLAGRPGGAQQLANATTGQPADILGSVASSLTGSAQVADRGTSLLSSLLGGGALGVLTSTLSKFLGIGEGPMRTMLGLLTPVIMGVLGREQRAAGLDVNGLARMLTGQKDEIATAIPSGLSRLLESSGIREDVAPSSPPQMRTYDSPRAAYGAPGTSTLQRMAGGMRTDGRGVSWPYWVLPLLLLGGLLWYLLPIGRETTAERTSQPTSEPSRVVPSKSAYLANAPDNWVSIGSTLNAYTNQDIYNRAGERLGTIKDVLLGSDGKMTAAIINVGSFLGLGDKQIAVPFSSIQVEQRDGNRRIVIDATKEALQAAPSFERQAPTKK
jgi:hypothetical protein